MGVKVLQGIFLVILTVVLSVAALLTASAFKWAEELPPVSEVEGLKFTATSQIFSANGTPIGEILPYIGEDRELTNRVNVSLDEVSPAVLWAVVASEDDQFFEHYGFDIPGIAKATYLEFLGDGGRGGSTITTQVIKNTLLRGISDERSLERKAKEIMLATELERRLTKPEILQRYLNVVYWGGNLYGVHAAAKAYFGKDPIELNLAEGLYLARLIPTPSANYNDFVAMRRAMRVVLDTMVEQGVVSREIADQAWRYPLEPTGWQVQYNEAGNIVGEPVRTDEQPRVARSVSSDLNPYVAFTVRNEMSERFGQDRLFGAGGFKIYTTIDVNMQEAANNTAQDPDGNLPPGAETAIVSVEPSTGRILAMVGGTPQAEAGDNFNRATEALRQPGSSFKPIIVATAIEQGGYTEASVVSDQRTVFREKGRPDWEPKNHDDTFVGVKTLRYHLDISRNIPIAKLVEAVTPEAVVERATELGYEGLKPYPSIALGAFEVTPLQHVSAMSAFANGGVHIEPHLIAKVTDAEGNILYEAQPRKAQVWSKETAYLMLDMLNGNVTDRSPVGFSNRAEISGRWVGGKTGTTNSDRDIWFVGTTPEITSAVWIGYDDNRSLPKTMPDGEILTSSRQPVRLWKSFTEAALAGTAPGSFTPPSSIVFKNINLATGAPSPGGTRVAFVRGTEPGATRQAQQRIRNPITITIPIDRRTETRATETTPRDQIYWKEILPSEVEQYTRPAPRSSDELSQNP